MKGFIRLLEAIMASLILIAVMPFFFGGPETSGWDNVILEAQSLDALAVLQKNGSLETYVKNNDIASLDTQLKGLLPKTMDYSVEINGIPNPVILIGCVCSDAQIDDLENILWPLEFRYKQRGISIRVSKMTLDTIDPRTRILFIFGYTDLNPKKAILDKFLEGGGTVFILGDLTQAQVEDGFINNTFGLVWDDAANPSGAAKFYEPQDVTKVSHRVLGYYINISGGDENDVFNGFNFGGGINQIAIDNRTVIYANEVSMVKINSFVGKNGKGRTAWSAGYDYTRDTKDAQEMKNLTKAAIMWASGENYKMDPYTKRPRERFLQARYIGILDGFEPFEITLTAWRLFA